MMFLACAACHKQLKYDAKRCSACIARTARRRASSDCAEVIHAGLEAAREKLSSLETKRRRSTRTQAALEAAVLAM